MIVKLIGRVLDVKHSKGINYAKFNDTEIGGEINLSIPGNPNDLKIDELVKLHAVIKPGVGKYGQYLKVEGLIESDTKGDK